jgi:hypothetical protein
MIPQLMESGFGAICVVFDVWGISSLVHGNLTKGRQYALESKIPIVKSSGQAKVQANVKANGHTNGDANGQVDSTALES